ncbi:hypothetical protein PENANT_c002G07084 [Penicillium antarcticum]|uniref:Uncharacterized protein n=1 Tax=Penicillium antarcticum TaxID=416450 RepID=A0A1V6QKA8_9EURO|nr:hypothetical protein PENANT_c002G07084 [Penicillium antarcticum]
MHGMRFDKLLFDRAKHSGVKAFNGTKATAIQLQVTECPESHGDSRLGRSVT